MAGSAQQRRPIATFSIVGADVARGELGIAVASKFLACGAVVPWASAGAGAVATQSYSNTAYGPDGIRMMHDGLSAEQTLARLLADDSDRALRQVGIVDARGGSAAHTGSSCHGWAGHVTGPGFAAQGNILVGEDTVQAMAAAFRSSTGPLSDRLVGALARGEAAGGDRRGRQASAVYVVKAHGGYGGKNDVLVDLRVDDHPDPVAELRRLLDLQHLYFGSGPETEKLAIAGPVLAELCAMMRRLNYLAPSASNDWNEATAQALDAFTSTENLEERVDIAARTIDAPALAYLRKTFG
jgi:uncharacterized Ntn-hydrolase superfamily protein